MRKRVFMAAAAMAGSILMGSTAMAAEETWSFFWYLCGSDLESDDGAATEDLYELLEVDLPENVTVIIETGGASEWNNETMDASALEFYIYNEEGFDYLGSDELTSMGDEGTLTNFLSFCHENYPADHEVVLFWNHGGGTTGGVAYDENFDYDFLSLQELSEAFGAVYEADEEEPPLEMVGFDACLMATLETADTLSGFANYLVASEETEPGYGWDYTAIFSALADDTSMSGAELGTVICDSFQEHSEDNGEGDDITLSVVDLTKIPALKAAYEELGQEALVYSCYDVSFLSSLSQNTERATNFGGNSKEEGYTDLVDLGDLVEQNRELLPNTADQVIDALEDAVVYKVSGAYAGNTGGLSCYYSFDGDTDVFDAYSEISSSVAFTNLFQYMLTGEVDDNYLQTVLDGKDTDWISESIFSDSEVTEVSDLLEEDVVQWQTFEDDEEDYEYSVYVDDDGYATMELDEDTLNQLKGVYMHLMYLDLDEDLTIWFGKDNDLNADWENGVFKDNFRDVWGAIDGNLCYMNIVYEGDDYNVYNVPIMLNGEEYQMRVVYDYDDEEYYILGARKGLDENNMSDRNLVQLKEGDEISTLLYAASIEGDDELQLVEIETFTVTGDTSFTEEELGDGDFAMMFELVDFRNETRFSDVITVTVEDGDISLEV